MLLRGTLDALAAQTLCDHEVIVVDDASTDGSADEALIDAAAGRPVRLVVGRGRGAVAARQVGVEAARADLLAFTDSDCIPDPGWLAAGVAALDDGADVVQGLTRAARPPRPMERTLWSTKDDGLFATCNVFYRRAAYTAAGGFESNGSLGFRPGAQLRGLGFGEDALLGWRVRRNGRARFVADASVAHHVFDVDVRDSLRRAWTLGAFPQLFRQIPELRPLLDEELDRGRRSRLPLYLVVGFVGLGRHGRRLASLSALWWLTARYRAIRATEPSRRRAVKVLPLDLATELVGTVALLSGSIRSRTMVL